MKRNEREKTKIDAKKNLKIKRFRDEMFDKLFFHDFLSRINEAWLAIWFEQQLMKKQKKNEKMKRIKNAENVEKVWKTAKKKKAKKTKSAICYLMFILLLYFVCKNLYSSCNRKRWILFKN
jgi:Lhr-like helicase